MKSYSVFVGVSVAVILSLSLLIVSCGGGNSGPTAPPDPVVPLNGGASAFGNTQMVEFVSIDIEKATNGVDADVAPGPSIPVDDTVTWSYRVTNNGNEALSEIVPMDDPEGLITCPRTALDAGESMICTDKTGSAMEGPYMNTATVTAEGSGGQVTDSDDSHYTGVDGGVLIALDIDKKTNNEDADSEPGPYILVGDEVIWSYTVTNNSEAEAIDIEVVDSDVGRVTCPDETLASGASMTCDEIVGTATRNQYENTATLDASVGGQPVTVTDLSHYFGSDPSIAIIKLTDGADGQELVIGCDLTWSYEITNDGNIDLENIVLTDDEMGSTQIDCPRAELGPGESMTCEVDGIVLDMFYDNVGTVTAEDIVGNTVSASDGSSYTGTDICTNGLANPEELWPPNHKLKPVALGGDVCGDAATFTVDGVTQDEPVNGTGDGDTSPDAILNGDGTVRIRSERAGGGNGRVYEIAYTAENNDGTSCTGFATVSVPHDQSGAPAIDDGQNYDSTLE